MVTVFVPRVGAVAEREITGRRQTTVRGSFYNNLYFCEGGPYPMHKDTCFLLFWLLVALVPGTVLAAE